MGHSIDLDYAVERDESHWTVNFQGQRCGWFRTREAALDSATLDAERVRKLGHRVRVLLRHADGGLHDAEPRPQAGRSQGPRPSERPSATA
ncbi:hypothetical protein GCM10009416_49680 [Craurococcus roseus]|uniref:DUF2188 domain-containing protein n=1 Tax=Craurococcus roseus TaxID=77585 RepID=A0ABP3RAJ1_9PROT